ncbi:hypothetical protein SAMN06295912_10666 [Sphingomonas laterariae]|uniref:Yip1 domain-containing protein n=1 Tax=Edaphosphingomonas laterariae TaxID=861865 RepID=A0A239EED4_9SPHN|nr:hypothetical protein [Sphingomonas laterariae]SNS42274.1 hypothetical protein SAMN06295912_10666 [Sphingomonas laterariae]
MDFLKLVRSLEELLYEVMTWLIFYPRTFSRTVRHPVRLAHYTQSEMGEPFDEQFTDMLSPPLFLMLSLLLAHGLELLLHTQIDQGVSDVGKAIVGSEQNLLIFRSLVFSLFPLMMAQGLLHRQHQRVDRKSLRRPFFLQCYYAGPYAIIISMSSVLARLHGTGWQVVGLAVSAIATVWYIAIETHWFHTQLAISRLRALGIALKLYFGALLLGGVIGLLLLGPAAG